MYCILIAGMPASGKSTLAAFLSQELGIPLLSKDSVKEILFDDLGFSSRAEKVRLGVAALDILYHTAGQLMAASQSLILENNFEDASLPGLTRLLARYGCTAVTVRLVGDPEVIYRRFAARDLSPTRHRGHVVNDRYPEAPGSPRENPTQKSYAQFLSDIEARGYCRFQAGGPVVEVDVTDLEKLDYGLVLAQVCGALRRVRAESEEPHSDQEG